MRGLVLEGGGAKGSYHIGAYKAILEEGIKIQGITGTSIGALNGAMIVQGDFELCYELWENISYSMIINESDEEINKLLNMDLNKEDFLSTIGKFKDLIKGRGFDITPFKELLNTYIHEDKIRKSSMDFGIVTINISDLKSEKLFIEDIPKGKLKDYLLASAYLPFFKMERLGGKLYLDGGFYDNLPFNLLYDKGYEDLILVRTNAPGFTRKIDINHPNTIIISPSEDIGKTYNYDAEMAKRNIRLGYYDGLKALRGLHGKRYYIKGKGEIYSINYLQSIDEKKIKDIGNILYLSPIPKYRLLFECIIPKLGSIMNLDSNFTYEDFLIRLLEKKAEYDGIDRFEIYSLEKLLSLIKYDDYVELSDEDIGLLEKLKDRIDLSVPSNKEELILKIANIIFSK